MPPALRDDRPAAPAQLRHHSYQDQMLFHHFDRGA